MKKHTIYYITLALSLSLGACNDYLDEMPDNRAEIDDADKITKILVSAYPDSPYIIPAELSSDNVDDYGVANPNTTRLYEELFSRKEVTEVDTDSPKLLWEACYRAIASSNQALEAIEKLGNPSSLSPQKGEALLARAYNHFLLVNMFSQHFSKLNSDKDLGVTYMTKSETSLSPSYERSSVKEVYENIVKDLELGLPLINDNSYTIPKFHFNKQAAYAFASRVALYMQDWNKAVEYSNQAIGMVPTSLMRDYASILSSGSGEVTNMANFYLGSSIKSNLMLQTGYSAVGIYFGSYYYGSRYSHGSLKSSTETLLNPEGLLGVSLATDYKIMVYRYSGTDIDKHLFPRVAYRFQITDPVAQIGYNQTVYAPFTTEEVLLTRAEAYVHLKQYDKALEDINRWISNSMKNPQTPKTVESINTWANGIEYSTPQKGTAKHKFTSEIEVEKGTQENMLHAVLFLRRVETIHTGLRWFDVKRYGIEVARRVIVSGNEVGSVDEAGKLIYRDKRAALQVPMDVINAGYTPNPR